MRGRVVIILFGCIVFQNVAGQVMNVRKWRLSERDSLDNALLLIDEKMYLHALPVFERLLAGHPDEDFLKYSYARTALYRADKHPDAYKYLSEVYEKNKKIPEINYELALACHFNNKFGEAEQYLGRFLLQKKLTPEQRNDAETLKRWIANAYVHYAKPTKARITNLGPAVNSADDEYAPAITADESMLVFTYAGEKSKGGRQNAFMEQDMVSGIFMEDIYASYLKDDKFIDAVPVDSLNTLGPDAALSLSADGRVLFLFKDEGDGHGDIYQSFLSGESFTRPVKLRGEVNSYSWDGHCSLSPDGRTLYFSSERAGGKGGRDIYRASLSADSSWTNVVNLGDSVNTAFDDDAPFISADGVTLFYSSKGRNSMGGYDIYRTTLNADSAFVSVEHLGYPMNSTADDIYFVMAANGKRGYYSSSRKGGVGMKDLYLVEPNFSGPAPAIFLVKGMAVVSGTPGIARIRITGANGREYHSVSNAVTGKFLFTLPGGQSYQLTARADSFPDQTVVLDATKLTGYNEKNVEIRFESVRDTTPVAPVVVKTPTVPAEKDGFVPRNKLHEKAMRYIVKNGDVTVPGLEFKVQVAALKNTRRYYLPHLNRYGRFEKLQLNDGLTRIMQGGSFKTLRKAFAFNKKVVKAGQQDAFVVAFLKGKRVQFEELVKEGVFQAP